MSDDEHEDIHEGGDEEEEQQEEPVPEPEPARGGGAQEDEGEDAEEKRRREERERKKAEVRARLEEAGRAKKAKKGFLTPERKKKLRKLLMMKAAEDLKQQQMMKEQERQKKLAERIIPLPDIESINDTGKLIAIAKQMWERVGKVEDEKYDIEYAVRQKDFEINELTIAVNDLRGKFVKPTLKKVSKYDSKLNRGQPTSKIVNFGGALKETKKDKFGLEALQADSKTKEEVVAEAGDEAVAEGDAAVAEEE